MHNPNHNVSPFNPVPPAALIVTAAILLIEAVLQLGQHGLIGGAEAVGWRIEMIQDFAFFDSVWERMLVSHQVRPEWIWPFFTYTFVSPSPVMAMIGAAMVISIGTHLIREYSTAAFVIVFAISTSLAALIFGLFSASPQPLMGPFPAMFGLLGLYSWNLWVEAKRKGRPPWGAFRMAGFLLAFQGLRWLIFGHGKELISEIAALFIGFAMGLVLTPEGRALLGQWFGRIRRG